MYVEHDTNDDASRKWRKCIVATREGSTLIPFLIDSIDIRKGVKGRYYRMDGWRVENNTWVRDGITSNNRNLITTFPVLGFVNVNKHPIYFTRKSDRVYKKGYTETTVSKFSVLNDELMYLGVQHRVEITKPEVVWEVFNRTHRSISEVCRGIYDKSFYGATITDNIAIAATVKSLCPTVFYKRYIVGFITEEKSNTVLIPKSEIALREELTEAGFNVEVDKG